MHLSAAAGVMVLAQDAARSGFLKPEVLRPAVRKVEDGPGAWLCAGCMKHCPSL